jgi:OOP family OmpA-OmpF porin
MKLELNKICRGVAASLAVLVATPLVHAQPPGTYVISGGTGGAVKDPFGDCVRSVGGTNIPECNPTPVTVVPVPAPIVVSLAADTNFDFDKSTLKPAGKATLDQLVSDMRQAAQIDGIDAVGYTDSIGTEAYNQRLSERRAQSVKDYLVSRGVDSGLITTRGMGESHPIATNDTPAGRAQNRRVDVTVDAKQVPSR